MRALQGQKNIPESVAGLPQGNWKAEHQFGYEGLQNGGRCTARRYGQMYD